MYLRRALDEPPPPRARPGRCSTSPRPSSATRSPAWRSATCARRWPATSTRDQRFRATMLLAGLLGQTGRVTDAVDLLEEHVEALADRPDLRATAEAALVNVTRIDPATRPRAAVVVERLRRRVDAGEERDRAVLGTIAAEMGMAGEPVGRRPRCRAGARRLRPDGRARRPLVRLHRGSRAGGGRALRRGARRRSTARWPWPASAARCSTSARRSRSAPSCTCRPATCRPPRSTRGRCWRSRRLRVGGGEGFAAAWLGEVLIERGELDEAERLLEAARAAPTSLPPVYTTDWVLLARGRLRLRAGRAGGGRRRPARVGAPSDRHRHRQPGRRAVALGARRTRCSTLGRARRGAAPGRRGARARPRVRRRRARSPSRCARAARVEGDDEIELLREAVDLLERLARAARARPRARRARRRAATRAARRRGARAAAAARVDLAHRCGADALEDQALDELRAAGARPRRRGDDRRRAR